jgi:hypothetical protein
MEPGEPEGAAPSRRGLVVAIAVGLVVVLLVGLRILAGSSDDDDGTDEETAAGGSSTTQETTAPTEPPPPPPPPTNPPPRPLPGLANQGVIDGLAGVGWSCSVETGMYPDHVQHNCGDPSDQAWLDMVSTPAGEVLVITVYGYEDRLGAFRDVASLGWTGVDGGEVAAWVESTVGSATSVGGHDRVFGEVPFSLVGDPGSVVASWSLELGRQPPVT